MRLFTPLYDAALRWARHRHAQRYLAGMSFAESVIFPVPPDVMLAPMCLANTNKAWYFALLTTLASVIGGILGYALGFWLFEPIVEPVIASMGWQDKFEHALTWFKDYGVWIVFLAGFSQSPTRCLRLGLVYYTWRFYPSCWLLLWGEERAFSWLRH